MGLFDKIRIWNIFAISKLGYVDQLLTQPECVQRDLEATLIRWLGGPNGWLSAESAFHLKETLSFPIAPRRPGAANLAAKVRTKILLTIAGKRVMRAMNSPNFGFSPMGFINHPCCSLWATDHHMQAIRLNTWMMVSPNGNPHGVHNTTSGSLQASAYKAICSNWHLRSPESNAIMLRRGITPSLSKHLKNNYNVQGRECTIRV